MLSKLASVMYLRMNDILMVTCTHTGGMGSRNRTIFLNLYFILKGYRKVY